MGQTTRTWTAGNSSPVWDDPGNWSPATDFPQPNDDVIISDALPHPEVDDDYTIGSMEIEEDGRVEFTAGGVLRIRSDLTDVNNVTGFTNWDAQRGTVVFMGNTHTSIDGRFHFYNMIVDKDYNIVGRNVQIEDDAIVLINHSLVMGDEGNLIAYHPDQRLILNATYNAGNQTWETAYADFNEGNWNGVFAGELTASQMFIDDFKTYHYLCSPVFNSSYAGGNCFDDSDLDDDFVLGATWDDTWTWAPNPNFVPDLIYYNETEEDPNTPGDEPRYGWQGESEVTGSEHLTATGEGVCARFRPKTVNSVLQPIHFTGVPYTGMVYSPEMTFTFYEETADGWNLIGNPYCRPISWYEAYTDANGDFPEIWAWQNDATEYGGDYEYFNASFVGTQDEYLNSFDGNIAIAQGFFVRAKANHDQVTWRPTYCLNQTNVRTFRTKNRKI